MPSFQPENKSSTFDISEYVSVLGKQKWFVLIFCISAMISSLAITYIVSEKYVSGTTILYRPLETSLLRLKETETFGSPVPVIPFKVIIQTLRDAARNEAVLRPVVAELGLDKKIEPVYDSSLQRFYQESKDYLKSTVMDIWTILKYGKLLKEDPTVDAIVKLRENVNVDVTKDSFIYILTVKDKFPGRAALAVDAIGERLEKWFEEQWRKPIERKIETLRLQMAQKEAEIAELREQKEQILTSFRLISVEDETSKGIGNLYEMRLELVRVNAQIEGKRKRISKIEEILQKGAKNFLQSDDFKRLKSEHIFENIELEGLEKKRDYFKTSIEQLETRLQQLPDLEKQIQGLEMKIGSLISSHENFKDLYTEALTQELVSQKEIKVLHRAVVPAKPAQPIKVYHFVLAGFLSLLISTSLAYVFDYLNIRIFFPQEEKDDYASVCGSNVRVLFEDFKNKTAPALLDDLGLSIRAEGGSIYIREKDALHLAHSLDPGHAPQKILFPPQKGSVFAEVAGTGNSLLIQDINLDSNARPSGWDGYRDPSLIIFPLLENSGEIAAIITCHNKKNPPFTQGDKELGVELCRRYLSGFPLRIGENRGQRIPKKSGKGSFRFLVLMIVGVFGFGMAGLVYYFLNKLGY